MWLIVVMSTFAATLVFKLMFLACSPLFAPIDVRSPSGHVAAATVVMGGLAVVFTRRLAAIFPAAFLAATVIGLSRLILGMHSLAEVTVGALIGFAGAIAFIRFAGRPPELKIMPLIGVVVVVTAVFHGFHLPAEAAIRHTAFRAAQYISVCRGTPEYRRHPLSGLSRVSTNSS